MNSVRRVLGASPENLLLLRLRCYSTRAARKPKPLPTPTKPIEIPFQPKLANSVNLIGQVHSPLQFQTSPDGNPWAATVITRQDSPSCPRFWIPVIFEGDLAHAAVSHLKPNDFIHIAGQLSTDPPHVHGQSPAQSNFQVVVQSLNFVQDYPQEKNIPPPSKQKIIPASETVEHINPWTKNIYSKQSEGNGASPSTKDIHSKQSEEHDLDKSWKDLLNNPNEWWDVRSTKENSKGAAFERKENSDLLFIDSSTPKWLQEKLESMTIDLKPELKPTITSAKKTPYSLNSWRELLNDPKQWFDFRDSKLNGSVNPRYPDFKSKDGSISLWLDSAPKWLSSKLQGLEFDVPVVKTKKAKDGKGDQSWKDLVENPTKWWDNRPNKRNVKAPDFKHKETGEALWVTDSPSWVLPKLPPMPEQRVLTSSN